jgi:hypothetical protein
VGWRRKTLVVFTFIFIVMMCFFYRVRPAHAPLLRSSHARALTRFRCWNGARTRWQVVINSLAMAPDVHSMINSFFFTELVTKLDEIVAGECCPPPPVMHSSSMQHPVFLVCIISGEGF